MLIIELLRRVRDLTQDEVSIFTKVPRSYIAMIESGRRARRSRYHVALERFFGFPFEFLASEVNADAIIEYLQKVVSSGSIKNK